MIYVLEIQKLLKERMKVTVKEIVPIMIVLVVLVLCLQSKVWKQNSIY